MSHKPSSDTGLRASLATAPGGEVLINIAGELDIASVERLRTVLRSAVDMRAQVVRVDASNLTFSDAAGLAAFAEAHGMLTARGGELRVENAIPLVRRVASLLDMTFVAD